MFITQWFLESPKVKLRFISIQNSFWETVFIVRFLIRPKRSVQKGCDLCVKDGGWTNNHSHKKYHGAWATLFYPKLSLFVPLFSLSLYSWLQAKPTKASEVSILSILPLAMVVSTKEACSSSLKVVISLV